MPDLVHELYTARTYPALSHPGTHPSRLAVAAKVGGISGVAAPAACRVLELGCSSGHNLLPMAAAYPDGTFVGIDFSEGAITDACERVAAAGLTNIRFEVADLATWQTTETFDYIIAHGVFSWVPDPVKERVLELCASALAPSGVASIGYNVLPGWSLRRDVAPLVRALSNHPNAPLGTEPADVIRRLSRLAGKETPYAAGLTASLENMLRKGGEILSFDDFGPVCDPIYFGQFVAWAEARGLRYLGESDVAENLPDGVGQDALESLSELAGDPVMLQQTLDLLSGRTHRSSLICRQDAPREAGLSTALVLDFMVSADRGELPIAPTAAAAALRAALLQAAPFPIDPRAFLKDLGSPASTAAQDARDAAAWIFQLARLAHLTLRVDRPAYLSTVPDHPRLSPLNHQFALLGRPVVDAWHVSCHFPAEHVRLLAQMDGSRTLHDLAGLARREFPDLDFDRWVTHLARRGLLV